ncbi:FAD-dependent monooxygenase [Lichenihabitans psoromatis]|uniref:FAD-dependent monooxygenase n=1 Tax=Lichenihabitans psoromatis TaxID=2528642 RepID=UPI00103562AB|nr:FAD-dependent monooxygenase [Lichenihabitans psoromatis]
MLAPKPGRFDIVVAGSGVAGLSMALAARQGTRARVAVCDAGLEADPAHTLRAVSIAADSRRLLERLGVWAAVAEKAQPMTEMVLTDARPGAVPPPVFLDFTGDAAPGEPFAHMVLLDDLRAALRHACGKAGIALMPQGVVDFTADRNSVRIDLGSAEPSLVARLLIAADGRGSRLRDKAGIKTTGWDYDQASVVATIAHEEDHGGRATQHFLPGGPLAILPMCAPDGSRRRFSLVWTERTEEAARLLTLDDAAFLSELRDLIGHGYGDLRLEDKPRAYPLRVNLARTLIAPRFALIGDAARTIHPLAGQGLNLGLRDVDALSSRIAEAMRLGLDPGAPDVLEPYQRARRADATAMAAATDIINRLFSNDITPLRLLRDFGLGLVDRSPGLKRRLIGQAAGTPPQARSPRHGA